MKLVWILALPLMAQEVIPLHPDWKPGATPEKIEERGKGGVKDRSIAEVSQPTLTVYLPSKEKATGKAILICPGGGYAHLAIDKEGHDVARWLNEIGIVGVVLKYRLPGSSNMRASLGDLQQARDSAKVAIEDAELAMKMVRTNASNWNVKPHSVGMMGFSAGGHLAAMLGMIGSGESKPDFLVLVYPAIPKGIEVTAATPKTFLAHADDDRLSAGENSVRFYLALKKAGVNSEMHIYSGGGHGFGVKSTDKTSATWPQSFASWVRTL